MNCCGFGHRNDYRTTDQILDVAIENAIRLGATCFLVGGRGEFDKKMASAVRRAKERHEGIRLELILPYFSQTLNTEGAYYRQAYDAIVLPSALAGVHRKAAIGKRNRWMVEQCELVLSGVYKSTGGAFAAVRYAEVSGKTVLPLYQ